MGMIDLLIFCIYFKLLFRHFLRIGKMEIPYHNANIIILDMQDIYFLIQTQYLIIILYDDGNDKSIKKILVHQKYV